MFDEIEEIEKIEEDIEECGLIKKISYVSNIYYCHIDEEIASPNFYRQIINLLKSATDSDEIHFIINTSGGDASSFIELFNGILQTNAIVVAEIITAYSAGALLALSCDSIIINKFASMMIHSLSSGASGQPEQIKGQSDFIQKWNRDILNEICLGFLESKEIEKIIEGKEMWFHSDEIFKRLENWIPVRKKITDKENQKNIRKKKK